MGTNIRNHISTNNPYWIEPHRYMELKHFCLQYPIWEKAYKSITALQKRPDFDSYFDCSKNGKSPTEKAAEQLLYYSERMDMVKNVAKSVDSMLFAYIVYGVTTGKTYEQMSAETNIGCSRNEYYQMYRKFFYYLNKVHY